MFKLLMIASSSVPFKPIAEIIKGKDQPGELPCLEEQVETKLSQALALQANPARAGRHTASQSTRSDRKGNFHDLSKVSNTCLQQIALENLLVSL